MMVVRVMRGARKRAIARRMCEENPTIHVGKAGVTQGLVDEVSRQLDKRRVVKLRVLRSALAGRSVEDVAAEVAQQTESTLVEVRGHTFVLYRRKRRHPMRRR